MKTLLNIKALYHFTKTMVPNSKDDQQKILIDGKKDEVVVVIMAYISREIYFHTSSINYLNVVWKKMKTLFDKTHEN